jgi:hypothetical protein
MHHWIYGVHQPFAGVAFLLDFGQATCKAFLQPLLRASLTSKSPGAVDLCSPGHIQISQRFQASKLWTGTKSIL